MTDDNLIRSTIPPFRSLDALRGFAALWVVTVHSSANFLLGGNSRFLTVAHLRL